MKEDELEAKVREQMAFNEETLCFGLARVGTSSQKISSGTLKQFMDFDMGEPMHSFIICGEMHEIEQEMFDFFKI